MLGRLLKGILQRTDRTKLPFMNTGGRVAMLSQITKELRLIKADGVSVCGGRRYKD
jgi:hypothetical protein